MADWQEIATKVAERQGEDPDSFIQYIYDLFYSLAADDLSDFVHGYLDNWAKDEHSLDEELKEHMGGFKEYMRESED